MLTALSYDTESGVFRWVQPPKKARHVRPGDVAGTLTEQGYVRIKYEGVLYRAHRLAWLFVHGCWPSERIDHINGVRSDNRIANLRDVPARTNSENRRRANANNSTGLLGVSRNGRRFSAVIGNAGRVIYLGTFDDPTEAHAVYLAAKARLHEGSTFDELSVGVGQPAQPLQRRFVSGDPSSRVLVHDAHFFHVD